MRVRKVEYVEPKDYSRESLPDLMREAQNMQYSIEQCYVDDTLNDIAYWMEDDADLPKNTRKDLERYRDLYEAMMLITDELVSRLD